MIHEKITRYFEANIVGSYLLVRAGLMPKDMVNDIDINICQKCEENVRRFLVDNGYKETKPPQKQPGYQTIAGSNLYTKERETNIHILVTPTLETVYSIPELIASKFERGTLNDLHQLESVIKSALFKKEVLPDTQ